MQNRIRKSLREDNVLDTASFIAADKEPTFMTVGSGSLYLPVESGSTYMNVSSGSLYMSTASGSLYLPVESGSTYMSVDNKNFTQLTSSYAHLDILRSDTINSTNIIADSFQGTNAVFTNFSASNFEAGTTGLIHRATIGVNGTYQTIKAAADWFNASASICTEFLLDSGFHEIGETVIINPVASEWTIRKPSFTLRGIGSNSSFLSGTADLSGPMFITNTYTDFSRFGAVAAIATGRHFLQYSGSALPIESEIKDITISGFDYGIHDPVGVGLFVFDFIISDCNKGIVIDHESTDLQYIDAEVGNFENCPIGVDLIKSGTGRENTILKNLMFYNPAEGIGIKYTGATYLYKDLAEISSCTHNGTGSFLSGFDFTRRDGRDANFIIFSNVGTEDKKSHVKLNVVDNTITTTLTNANTFYKVNGILSRTNLNFNAAATSGSFTFTVDDQTTAAIAWNASAADIKAAIEALSNVTAVTVTQVVASKQWIIQFDTAEEGWVNQSCDITGLATTASVSVGKSFYTCKATLDQNQIKMQSTVKKGALCIVSGNMQVNTNNRNVTVGIKVNNTGDIISPITIRIPTANQPVPFSIVAYLEDLLKDHYVELWASSANAGDVIILQDMALFFDAR